MVPDVCDIGGPGCSFSRSPVETLLPKAFCKVSAFIGFTHDHQSVELSRQGHLGIPLHSALKSNPDFHLDNLIHSFVIFYVSFGKQPYP